MISIKDIAKQAGVSVSTVSRVINGKDCVRPEKRDHVLQVIQQTGFVPNRAARDMVLKSTSKVGIFLPETFNQFQRQLFSEIAHNLESLGFHTSFFFIPMHQRGEHTCLQKMKSERLDGVILLREIELPEFREYLTEHHIPTVLVTFEHETWSKAATIHISEEEAAYVAVTHLIGLGHRRIALVGGKKFSFGTQRELGYRRAITEANISWQDELVVYVDAYHMAHGMMATQRLLEQTKDFSAVFAITDDLAIGCIRQLKDQGYSIPRDISVVGIDDIEISSYITPRLTTIQQPLKEMGRMAVSLLHEEMHKQRDNHPNSALPFTLIKRESTATPKTISQEHSKSM